MEQIHSYKNEDQVLVAVDCIIFGFDPNAEELKILLVERGFEPFKGKWSLMGGFLHLEETLKGAANRVLKTLTGLSNVYLEQLQAFSTVDRDPVERTISVAYYALINIAQHNDKLTRKHAAQWFNISSIPDLIFDHNDMVNLAIRRLRYRAATQPIGFELLPEKFTMRQLQKLYEEIWDTKLDKRNFIKKFIALDVLEKLDEKDMDSSKRGSYLFRFNQRKFIEQKESFKLTKLNQDI